MTQLCLTTYHFPSFTHTHSGDDTLPRNKNPRLKYLTRHFQILKSQLTQAFI